ncbi:toll/interleukin-1 receptor domain-containing protein [Leptospira alstonii]|uniref:toll/interleukin-1 receptor domain-containing protein n=1 Tax=Leptospira alstonii TaxID=28452 RepID=UPI000772E457|nr:toll/interleukin-1 receptor domain-containing protein [Leptospira alstonii]
MNKRKKWDLFISHASEDKKRLVAPLAKKLTQFGSLVWYDEFSLKPGDSLSESIDRGLANSKFGIVVLSKNFFTKSWARRELQGLVARQVAGGSKYVLIPIWFEITKTEILKISPPLADILAINALDYDIAGLAIEVLKIVRPDLAYHANRVRLSNYIKQMIKESGQKPQMVDPRTLKPSRAKPATLLPNQTIRIVVLHCIFKETISLSLLQYLYNFSRDLNPESEIQLWERLAAVYLQLVDEWKLNSNKKKALLSILLQLSSGVKVSQIQSKYLTPLQIKKTQNRLKTVLPRYSA